ncbi:T9SS type A sorting domain-containing protein [Aurantibacillus circumpalustris]|uniref:T9SS type A sorting domain-containing protein n=1 Tax=Aurantibacillus circumpalustris TaxID=3036359 RepID=UPI00295BE091|nr:T9SS type A sorting domain-containing protein [Aurantibacillus circumpalustris]
MKKRLAFCILACINFGVYGQKQNWIWYFGDKAGLDFSTGVPVVLTNGVMTSAQGCAAISDSLGNLQFYTDGAKVWNKNHIQMSNGFGLQGNQSSTQSALIVPKPSSTNIYYIFTVPAQNALIQFSYSEVDITLNGGLGDVTAKNINIFAPVLDKLTAVLHANGTDFWVLCHEQSNSAFRAYLVTSNGVSATPVTSNVGTAQGSAPSYGIGYLKASPNGAKLCMAVKNANYSELFDFNNATGAISNPLSLSGAIDPYGVEFSPDNSKLYIASSNVNGQVYQYNLAAGSNTAISGSGLLLSPPTPNHWYGALQLATDGKIYVSQLTKKYLGVISNPNTAGTGCGFQDSAIYLGTGQCQNGLPNFIKKYSPGTITTTGLHASALNAGTGFRLFPNPNSGVFKIQFDYPATNAELIVTNSLGQNVCEKQIVPGLNEFILSELSTGLYSYVLVRDKERIITGKLLIE